MSEEQCELTVRRFFDHYLAEVFPKQLTAAITAHNRDVTAHSRQIKEAVQAESSRLKLWLIGLIFTTGVGGGFGVSKLIAAIAGQ